MSRRKNFFYVCLVISLLLLSACGDDDPQPTTYTPGCNVNNLIGHINQANNAPEPAIINLDPNCPYILTEAENSVVFNNLTHHSGLPAITSEITINGNNAVIDIQRDPGEPAFGHFFVDTGGDLELYDLTLENGIRQFGGAVINFGGDFFASNTNFLNNAVYPIQTDFVARGGAIYNDSGRVRIIDNSLFQGNHAGETTALGDNLGGAIYNLNGNLAVYTSTFDLNFAAGSGGAIYAEKDSSDESGGLILVNDSFFSGNSAIVDGGAIALINELNEVIIATSDFSENRTEVFGGAIYAEASNVEMSINEFTNNSAAYGGAIFSKRLAEGSLSTLTINNTEFIENTAEEIGGAIFSENSDLTLEGSDFDDNIASSCGALRNGGSPSLDIIAGDLEIVPHVPSITRISDSFFYRNIATLSHGGAICHLMGNVTIQESYLSSNQAAEYGGAILISDEIEINGTNIMLNNAQNGGGAAIGYPLQYIPGEYTWVNPAYMTFQTSISESNIWGNEANGAGGGVWAHHGGTVTIAKSTFSSNTSYSAGGGLYQETGDLYITNSTFSGNTGYRGGGLYTRGCITTNPVLEIKHSTFTLNNATDTTTTLRSGGGGLNINGIVDITNSLITQNTNKDCDLNQCLTYSRSGSVDSDETCGFSGSELNPMLGPLWANGGPTGTHALLQGSPLIDILPGCANITEDQRGEPRPQGGACDPGAYEFDPNNPPAPPPPPPTPEPDSSSYTRCDPFDEHDLTLILHSIPLGTTNLTLYTEMLSTEMLSVFPGSDLAIPGDQAPWIYTALLGDTESDECYVYEFASRRLYCDFVLPATALGSTQNFSLHLNECEDPIFFQPRVSILEPQEEEPTCNQYANERSCLAYGGTFYKVTDDMTFCVCP